MAALDVGTKLDLEGIAVRTGHHCCQPLMERMRIPGTSRASFAMYNTVEEVNALADALEQILASARPRAVPVEGPAVNGAAADPAFPAAAAATPEAAAEALADDFDTLDDWADKYQYLIDLSGQLPPMPAALQTEANRVHGCQATVYMHARVRPGTADVIEFLASSDADLVSGELVLLQRVFSGQRAGAIVTFDVDGFIQRLGLNNLTSRRRVGLDSMIKRLRGFAATVAAGKAKA
jgi:cysteine desulfurase/selenocysteine lyase